MICTDHRFVFPLLSFKAWRRRSLLILLAFLFAWEGILNGYKLSRFPLESVDFFQYYFLGWWVQHGGKYTDPTWVTKVTAWGLCFPEDLRITAPYLSYQPILLPFFRLLSMLPPTPAAAVWLFVQVLLLVWAGVHLARLLKVCPLSVVGGILVWPPVWHVLNVGNIDATLAACTIVGLCEIAQGHWLWGGFLIGISTAFKGIPAFAVFPWLFHRQSARHVGAGLFLGVLFCALISLLSVGSEGIQFLLTYLPTYQAALVWFTPINGSLFALFRALAGPLLEIKGATFRGVFPGALPVQELSLTFGTLLFGWGVWWSIRHQMQPTFLYSGFWISLGLLIWPASWINYHLYLIPALAQALSFYRAFSVAVRRWFVISLVSVSIGLLWWLLISLFEPWMIFPFAMVTVRLCLAAFFARAVREICS